MGFDPASLWDDDLNDPVLRFAAPMHCGTRIRASCHIRLGSAGPPGQSHRDILHMMGMKKKTQ